MAFWLVFGLWAFTTVAGWLTRPKVETPKAAGLGDFQIPTIDSVRPIPVIWGTVLQKAPNLVWYGDLSTGPIKVSSGFLGLSSTTVGYFYDLGMQLVLCHGPVDALYAIRFDDKECSFTQSPLGDHQRVAVDDGNLFGGDTAGGGVRGFIDFYWGTSSQAANDYLQDKITADMPGFRQVSYAVLRGFYVGTSPTLRNIAFEIARYPNQLGLGSGHHVVGTRDANPACALYELLINRLWGCGDELTAADIDLASFQAAGETLWTEGLGISMQIDTLQDARSAKEELERYMDGVLFEDPATGLITLKLVRNDYDPNTLPVYTDADFDSISFSRGSWRELANTDLITYTERPSYQKRIAQQQNLSAIQSMGGARKPESFDFSAVTKEVVANAIAARELKPRSYPLAKMTFVAKRKAYALRPGSVFKWNSTRFGISGMAVRVLGPKEAELMDGRITLECVEDVFGIADTAFGAPAPSTWVDPVVDPSPVPAEILLEVPYHLLGSVSRYVFSAAVRSAASDLGYQTWSDRTGGTNYELTNNTPSFTPSGLLSANYNKNTAATDATGFTITSPVDLVDVASVGADEFGQGVNLLQIDSEIMAFQTVVDNGDGTFTIHNVMRGVLDTVPADHSSGARVWFLMPHGAAFLDPASPYTGPDGTVRAKLLPYNSRRVLPIASASAITITTASRAYRPYPPGNVKIASVAWPTSVTGGVDIAVTWAIRHRVQQYQDHAVVPQDAGDYTISPEGDYTVEVRVGGTLKRTVNAILGTSWTWTAAMQATDGATVGSSISIRVIPKGAIFSGTYQERLFTIA